MNDPFKKRKKERKKERKEKKQIMDLGFFKRLRASLFNHVSQQLFE